VTAELSPSLSQLSHDGVRGGCRVALGSPGDLGSPSEEWNWSLVQLNVLGQEAQRVGSVGHVLQPPKL
jgi:hypothetical protein